MSIGIGDTVADDATMAKVNSILEEAKGRVQDVIERFQTGQLEGQPGRTMMEAFEAKCAGRRGGGGRGVGAGMGAWGEVRWGGGGPAGGLGAALTLTSPSPAFRTPPPPQRQRHPQQGA
jgi:hypothetical protein